HFHPHLAPVFFSCSVEFSISVVEEEFRTSIPEYIVARTCRYKLPRLTPSITSASKEGKNVNIKTRALLVEEIPSPCNTISHSVKVLSIKSHGVNRIRSHKMGFSRYAAAKFAMVIQ
ncbi:hypothetical protein, partial [Thermococcus thioreducens]|uniref:hypothetical protein n=1 Tax=Thermococcus thioreducens TaxID=277988 RepID=UPI001B8011BE